MKKKSTIAVVVVLAVLAVGVAVLAVLNGKNAAEKKRLLSDAEFLIVAGETEHRVSMEDIEALGPLEFEANYKKSGKDPEVRYYTGVPFAEILRAKGIETGGLSSAVFSAADGYSSILSMEDALGECYIAIDDGGDGPFRMILPKAQFSQGWCKMLTDVHLR